VLALANVVAAAIAGLHVRRMTHKMKSVFDGTGSDGQSQQTTQLRRDGYVNNRDLRRRDHPASTSPPL
jgi:hypothetical protein